MSRHRCRSRSVIVLGLAATMSWSCATSHVPSDRIARYLRPAGAEFQAESEIRLEPAGDGRSIASVTWRDDLTLTLRSRYGPDGRLLEAGVTTATPGGEQSAAVTTVNGKIRVSRDDRQQFDEFDCPPGVIVTSAPDWTDAFLAVLRYDSAGSALQEFAGLWIHPRKDPFRLTFKVTDAGEDTVMLAEEPSRLDRLLVELRGGSRYVGWRNAAGELVRLVPEGNAQGGIVLQGWEEATHALKPEE